RMRTGVSPATKATRPNSTEISTTPAWSRARTRESSRRSSRTGCRMNAEGLNKAALLLMSIGESEAAEVFKYLGPREVQKIGATMATLKNVTREQLDNVMTEFVNEAEQHTALSLDSSEYIRAVLTKALGETKGGALIDRILQGTDTRGIEGLKWMDSGAVAER